LISAAVSLAAESFSVSSIGLGKETGTDAITDSIRSKIAPRSRSQVGSQIRTTLGQRISVFRSSGAASRSVTVGRSPQAGPSSSTATCQRSAPGARTTLSTVKWESPKSTSTS
jgi:hypothetical protein